MQFSKNKISLSVITLFFVIFHLYSCNERSCYRFDVSEISIDSVPNESLIGIPLPLDMTDVDVFYFIDSVLLVHRGADYFNNPYTIHNSITFDSITSFGMKGRSKNEFLSNPVNYSKQVYIRNGDYIIPLMDWNICKEVNLNKTLAKNFAVVENVFEGINFTQGSAVMYGPAYHKQFIFVEGHCDEIFTNENELPKIIYVDENGDVEDYCVYSRYPQNDTDIDASQFYSGNIYKQPEGNVVAQPLYQMNYILFYDIEKRDYHAVHISGSRTFEDGIPKDEEEQHSVTFLDDAAFTKDYFFVLYWGMDYNKKKKEDPDYHGRILKFDWNGNLMKTYTLHDKINRLSINPSNNVLYGSNYWNGSFYSFGDLD